MLQDNYFELRYEDILQKTESVVPSLVDFINRDAQAEKTADLLAHINETKRLGSLYGWKKKMSQDERYIFEAVAGDMLESCGYETEYDGKVKLNFIQPLFYGGQDIALRIRNRLVRDLEPE